MEINQNRLLKIDFKNKENLNLYQKNVNKYLSLDGSKFNKFIYDNNLDALEIFLEIDSDNEYYNNFSNKPHFCYKINKSNIIRINKS